MTVPATAPNEEERSWGMYGHLAGLFAHSGIPFGGVIGPWIIYLQSKTQRPFAAEQARSALNFHITAGLLQFVLIVTAMVCWFSTVLSMPEKGGTPAPFGAASFIVAALCFFGYFAAYVWSFVFTLIGTSRASNGLLYYYPLTIPFVRGD